jgi:hypothetical protein
MRLVHARSLILVDSVGELGDERMRLLEEEAVPG